MENGKPVVVSSAFEVMLGQKFHTYAGGLGAVHGAILKSAGRNDWPVNMYGLSMLWKDGYYDQKVGPSGMITDEDKIYKSRSYDFLEDTGVRVRVIIDGHSNIIKVWRLPPEVFKTVPIFFLDTDISGNDHLARSITQRLYTGNERQRLAQEIVKGIGGVRALEALGIKPDLYHGHECHSLLIAAEILRQNMALGMSFEEAQEATRQKFVFATHTPELGGNEEHDIDLMIKMGCFPDIPRDKLIGLGGNPFSMTVAGLRLAKRANAVSELHCQTANAMWQHVDGRCQIVPVTNGVDLDWQYPEFAKADSAEAIILAKEKYQTILFRHIFKRTGKQLDENILTIVWARRFAEYKRPWLIFDMDWPWIEKLLKERKIQIIIAGKPHPNDQKAVNTFNWLYRRSLDTPGLVVLAGYEYWLSKILKAGADLWFQCPRRPREACGTSWISANFNGTLVLFSLDGGILQSANMKYGFPFGVDYKCSFSGEQDKLDFQDLVKVLPNPIDMFYNDKSQWYQWVLAVKKDAVQNFNSDRMLRDYINSIYLS
ncbi:MAG: alpha-glucan family phosphorylase [Candidatus Nealsonbacteria bacterium]|nr:alpha-glucan family phosphorylase [Candidatus Nealsonbacteria bacterium]